MQNKPMGCNAVGVPIKPNYLSLKRPNSPVVSMRKSHAGDRSREAIARGVKGSRKQKGETTGRSRLEK